MVLNRLQLPIELPYDRLVEYCQKWKITRLEVFGSVLRSDFGPESDVDFLVTFEGDARWSLFDIVHAEEELVSIVGRPVDLVSRGPIERSENWIRRRSILGTAKLLYAT